MKRLLAFKNVCIITAVIAIYQIVLLFWCMFYFNISGQIRDVVLLFAIITSAFFLTSFLFKKSYIEWLLLNRRILSLGSKDEPFIDVEVSYRIITVIVLIASLILSLFSATYSLIDLIGNIGNLVNNILNVAGLSSIIILLFMIFLIIFASVEFHEKRMNQSSDNTVKKYYFTGIILMLQNMLLSLFILKMISSIGI